MRHDQSSINKINSKVLDGCRDFLWRDEERAPLICREKVTELLTAEDLVVTCKGSFKQNMISHLSIKCKKVLDSCRGFLWRDEEWTPLIYGEKSHRIGLQLKTWCYLYHLIQTRHDQSTLWDLSGIQGSTFVCRRPNVSHQQLNFEIREKNVLRGQQSAGHTVPSMNKTKL